VTPRPVLTYERVVEAAARVADRVGIDGVSMRAVGKELGVEAMSLYHHVEGKDALLDGLADWWFTQVELPQPETPWRQAMVDRADCARRALQLHPWALGLVESRRSPGPALLRHHEAVLACLRTNGFPVVMASHAFSALDAYVYGFVLTEITLPFDAGSTAENYVEQVRASLPAKDYPYLLEMLTEQVIGHDYTYGQEFSFGLDLVLDGLQTHLDRPDQPGADPGGSTSSRGADCTCCHRPPRTTSLTPDLQDGPPT